MFLYLKRITIPAAIWKKEAFRRRFSEKDPPTNREREGTSLTSIGEDPAGEQSGPKKQSKLLDFL